MKESLDPAATAALLPFPALVAALRRAVDELARGAIACPPRQVQPLHNGASLLSMVAGGEDVAVHKLISVVPDNPGRGLPTISGQLSVVDAVDGAIRLILDGATVTERRTAALSMLGVETLLGRAPRRVLLVGTGVQALSHAKALAALYPGVLLDIAGRSAQSVARFCMELGVLMPYANRPRYAPADARNPHEETDLVITATTSSEPVYTQPARAGRLLIAVGSFKPHAAEIGAETVRASRILVDDPHGAEHEAGDLIRAGVDCSRLAGLSTALGGAPLAASGPVLLKTVGCAAWDLAAARVALMQASDR
ncbi:MAG TPA: delta(1)-pyrroline-2-carboxylate reductase family protein [Pseudoduganella sp.]